MTSPTDAGTPRPATERPDPHANDAPGTIRARRGGFVADVVSIAGRAVRSIPREPEAIIPALMIPLFFFIVNTGSLQDLTELGGPPGFDYKAFQLPVAIVFAVTGVSRANVLVLDIQGGYFDRLMMTPVSRLALLLGLMVADFVLVASLSIPVVALGFVTGVTFETGILGVLVFILVAASWGLVFTGFPYAIALKTGSPAAVNSSFLLFFPFAFLTTAFVPREALTGWLDTVAGYNPVTYLLDGLRSLVSEGWEWATLGKALAAVCGVGVVSMSLALSTLHGRVTAGMTVDGDALPIIVQKFGGTSVADPERIREVADHAVRTRRRGHRVVLVVSAMGKETDHLLRLAGDVSTSRPGREMDMLVTAGERKAMALVAMAICDLGVEAQSFTGSQAGFITDTNHTDAKITELRPHRIIAALDAGMIPVLGGSQGVSSEHDVTFLGRGGSDTTAVAIAHALGAEMCELYTDVPGVFTADPRVVLAAQRIGRVTFDELLEMTAVGCPKPAMRSVEFARRHGVPLHVRSAFTWEPGTIVTEETPDMEQAVVRAVVPDTSEAKVTITGVPDEPGVAAKLFRTLADAGVNVDMIVQNISEGGRTDISFTVPHAQADTAEATVADVARAIGAETTACDHDIARVSVVGAGMKTHPGVAATMFTELANAGINIEMISTSAIRISCVVREGQAETAVQILHTAFGLDG